MTAESGDAQARPTGPAPGDARPGGGDGATAPVTSGGRGVMSGVTSGAPPWAFALGAAITLSICSVNVLSQHHDRPHAPIWLFCTWEYSSGAVTLLLLPLVARVMRMAGGPGDRGWALFLAIHAVAVVAYSLLHVTGFVLARKAVYLAAGHAPYTFGGFGEWLYEFRKDALSYALMGGVFAFSWIVERRDRIGPQAAPPSFPATFDIRDGARVIRTPMAEILAVVSAGNYVEFRLADGRTPLMRATLAAIDAELAPHGFVRTHRSWLVNRAAVREIAPTGTGDARLLLGGGLEAPLSRRYPQAAEAMRQRA